MSIYLISNRELMKNGKFRDDGKESALPTFRIAKCEPDPANEGKEESEKKVSYTLLPDTFPAGYENVVKALKKEIAPDTLCGSEFMFYDLYSQMIDDKEKKSDVLFFIHGFANSFDDNLGHIYRLSKLYIHKDSPIKHIVYVCWPTRSSMLLTYWSDQEDAEETGKVLGRLFSKLHGLFVELFEIHRMARCGNRIHLAAHSMGNQVLKHMLECIPDNKLVPLFGETILLHSDVEDTVFEHGQPFTKLEKMTERTHIYIHRSDDALRISRATKNFKKRLGHKGPKDRKVLNSETFIVDTSNILKSGVSRETIIDHWGYLERPEVVKDITFVLHGTDEDTIKGRDKWEEERNYFVLKAKKD